MISTSRADRRDIVNTGTILGVHIAWQGLATMFCRIGATILFAGSVIGRIRRSPKHGAWRRAAIIIA